jgi:hypothetical protein
VVVFRSLVLGHRISLDPGHLHLRLAQELRSVQLHQGSLLVLHIKVLSPVALEDQLQAARVVLISNVTVVGCQDTLLIVVPLQCQQTRMLLVQHQHLQLRSRLITSLRVLAVVV